MNPDRTLRWLRLHAALRDTPDRDALFNWFPDPTEVFDFDPDSPEVVSCFDAPTAARLFETTDGRASEIAETCGREGVAIVTAEDPLYPEALRDLKDFPLVLFARGDPGCLADENGRRKLALSVVGSRNASPRSLALTSEFCGDLAREDIPVVSGGALGVDSAAHMGALEAGGVTVCVLGSGMLSNYLMDNEPLRRRIAEDGAVLTELFPREPASRLTFPRRNRLIAALGAGTLVMEAASRSGSLITARWAASLGRDLFAVAGDRNAEYCSGTNRLLADGARAVFYASDIIGFYEKKSAPARPVPERARPAVPKRKPAVRALPDLDADEKALVAFILVNDGCDKDTILDSFPELSVPRVVKILLSLESKGAVRSDCGRYYVKW